MGKCVWDRDVGGEVMGLPRTHLANDAWSPEGQISKVPESLYSSSETRVELQGEVAFRMPLL